MNKFSKLFISKKGDDKSLQMIFGLFVLLIISLVVLSLFFRFTRSGTGTMSTVQEKWFSQNQIAEARDTCKTLLDEARGPNGMIQFCRKTVSIESEDPDKIVSDRSSIDLGMFMACENFIPCFLLTIDEPNAMDGNECKRILSEYAPDILESMKYKTPQGNCSLPVPTNPEEYPKSRNWVVKYGYYKQQTSQQ
ncbi:MAG: hypothetical protein QXU20_03195 [Candidatus Woesearchaeota archaeon]